jgi:hypothetical protein
MDIRTVSVEDVLESLDTESGVWRSEHEIDTICCLAKMQTTGRLQVISLPMIARFDKTLLQALVQMTCMIQAEKQVQ